MDVKDESLSILDGLSPVFLQAFFPSLLFFYYFYLGLLAYIHHTYTHIKPYKSLSPPHQPPRWRGRGYVGCACVCVLRVCRLMSFFTSSFLHPSIHYIFITSSVITTFSFFPCRTIPVEKGELSLHSTSIHSSSSLQQCSSLTSLSFSFSMFSNCGLGWLLDSLFLDWMDYWGTFSGSFWTGWTLRNFLWLFLDWMSL